MYLIEALKYNVPSHHEDRLTQIVSATFNESKLFQLAFLSFLKVPHTKKLISQTQVSSEKSLSRPDLIIYSKNSPYVIIESKIESESSKAQQQRHSKIEAKYYFLIARDPVLPRAMGKHFKKVTWSDFFSFLEKLKLKSSGVDFFLIDKLINFGKACGMILPDRIAKSDFEIAKHFFTQMRLSKFVSCAFDQRSPFQSLDIMALFLERAILRIKDDPIIGKQVRPFTRRLKISCAAYVEVSSEIKKEKNLALRHELRAKTDIVTLEKEIGLKKSIGGLSKIFVRISFVPFYKNKDLSACSLDFLKAIDVGKIKYRCEVEAGLCDSKGIYNQNTCIAFEDTKDLEFSYFFAEARKIWKRKIS